MRRPLIKVEIRVESDVVLTRQRAKQVAELLGFDNQTQTRIATAVSEIARNAFRYAARGTAEFFFDSDPTPTFWIEVRDQGPGIADLEAVLQGRYTSTTGMGMGILGCRRLMDRFEIRSEGGVGTTVLLGQVLPRTRPLPDPKALGRFAEELARRAPESPAALVQEQNRELIQALETVEQREADLQRLNRELEETNRGVVALYAELEEKAEALKRASDLKSRFLSNVSHEFRTPLNSVLSLSRLLLDRVDGPLTSEQERQVTFIQKSAEALTELINDLLDLAKIEAGKTEVRPKLFELGELFAASRGMMRPLLTSDAVTLTFEDPAGLPPLYTDEGKVSQILRNFTSNALKFTERGEVRVRAERAPGGQVVISCTDTGIGIPPEHQQRIFEEFNQVEGPHQRKVKGTGLGLPLSKKLAELLGGTITLESVTGRGSTFRLFLPAVFPAAKDVPGALDLRWRVDAQSPLVLIRDDDAEARASYEKLLAGSGVQAVVAATEGEARSLLEKAPPRAVVLGIGDAPEATWEFLGALRRDPATAQLPVFVIGPEELENQAIAQGASGFHRRPFDAAWLLNRLETVVPPPALNRMALIADDDEVSRYLVRRALTDTGLEIREAAAGDEALARARAELPSVLFLDLMMPGLSGFEVLAALKADPRTRRIAVIINTSKRLTDADREALRSAELILSKDPTRKDPSAGVRDALRQIGLLSEGHASG